LAILEVPAIMMRRRVIVPHIRGGPIAVAMWGGFAFDG